MKTLPVLRLFILALAGLGSVVVSAQTVPTTPYPNGTSKPTGTISEMDSTGLAASDSTVMQLDQAIAANAKGDKAATAAALQAGASALETEAKKSTGDFKDKLLGQIGNLKKMIPLAKTGALGGGVLAKAVSLVKMALGANRLSGLLGGGSLTGKTSALTGGLNLVKAGLGALGGSTESSGSALINGALGAVGQLKGPTAAVAEPVVKSSIGSVLNFAKGIL